MKFFLVFCILWPCLMLSTITCLATCDSDLDESKLNDVKIKNSILDKGIVEFHINVTTLVECVSKCCEKINCNYAFLKELHECYLVSCVEESSCRPIPNPSKQDAEPADYLVKIRTVAQSNHIIEELLNKEKTEISKLEHDIFHTEKNQECAPSNGDKDCALNEICRLKSDTVDKFECVCPKEHNYRRINGVCREFLPKTDGCVLYVNECDPKLNEECLNLNEFSKHGTCQCKLGFKRNPQTFLCELAFTADNQPASSSKSNRRRPSPAVSLEEEKENDLKSKYDYPGQREEYSAESEENDETLFESILQKLGFRSSSSDKQHQHSKQSKSTTTTSTIPTTTTSTSTTTEPPNISTNNLQANAGLDLHIYYPLRTCILNGTLTQFYSNIPGSMIVRWLWVKSDNSPAFGRFVETNEGPIVIYEQLVTGLYKFTLKVWTNTNEFSQSSVNVYVHPYLNDTKTNESKNNQIVAQKSTEKFSDSLNQNIIEIELDLEPRRFTEYIKDQFLSKFQLLLQQHQVEFKLTQPKVILVNSRIMSPFTTAKSKIILELIVTDVIDAKIVSVELPVSKMEDRVYYANMNIIGPNRRLVSASALIPKLRRNLKSFEKMFEKLDYVFSYLKLPSNSFSALRTPATKHDSLLEYFDIKISSINILTCTNDELASSSRANFYNCSNHGKCDTYSHKCVCDKFYMFNFFSYYFDFENDLTNGNNCEYNILLVILVLLMIVLGITVVLNILIRYFFYYICCCCCCSRKNNADSLKGRAKYIRKLRDDSYLDDDEEKQSGTAFMKTNGGKLLKKMTMPFGKNSLTDRHKYSLLNNNDENDSLLSNRSLKSIDQSPIGSNLNYDDDEEDVVYEEKLIKNGNAHNKKRDEIKKYSVI